MIYVLYSAPCCDGMFRIPIDEWNKLVITEQFVRLTKLGYTPVCPCFIAE